MKLRLKYPLQLEKKMVEELTFRDYTTADDYLAFDIRGGVAQNITLIANLTGTDEVLIKRLRGPDYKAACQIVDKIFDRDDKEFMGMEDAEKKSSES